MKKTAVVKLLELVARLPKFHASSVIRMQTHATLLHKSGCIKTIIKPDVAIEILKQNSTVTKFGETIESRNETCGVN